MNDFLRVLGIIFYDINGLSLKNNPYIIKTKERFLGRKEGLNKYILYIQNKKGVINMVKIVISLIYYFKFNFSIL
jgi:hypothetical protein